MALIGFVARKVTGPTTSDIPDLSVEPETPGQDTVVSLEDMVALQDSSKEKDDIDARSSSSETSENSEFNDGGTSLFQSLGSYFWSSSNGGQPGRKASYISGLDGWVPSDCNQIVAFPMAIIDQYARVYPLKEVPLRHIYFSVLVDGTAEANLKEKPPVYHLALTLYPNSGLGVNKNKQFSLSMYRNRKVTDVIALCERCRESRALFRQFPKGKDKTVVFMASLVAELRMHLLWKSEHIAASLGIIDYFQNPSKKIVNSLSVLCRPEGYSPLMIAVQSNNEELVKLMLSIGADPTQTDVNANNVLHFAATVSPSMIMTLWDNSPSVPSLLNHSNHDGSTPSYLAWSSVNGRCAATFMSFSKKTNPEAKAENPLFAAMKSKNTSPSQFRAILEKYPNAYSEKDSLSGNCAIHCAAYKKPLMDLIDVVGDKLDVNCRNNLQWTPLHIFVNKNDVSLVFTLLGCELEMDAKDNEGNTPLHVAVSNLNVEIVRTLLCFGSDPNIRNNHDETPRHLAAKFKDSDESTDIIRSLIMFGATTCAFRKLGCTFACVHREKFVSDSTRNSRTSLKRMDGEKAASPPPSDDQNEDEKVARTQVESGAPTQAYEFELNPDTHDVDEAYAEPNPTRMYPQQYAIRKVLAELAALKNSEESNIITVLSCDGGGIKGLVMVQLLIILQRYLEAPVQSYFDWMGGTSTGTFVAGCMGVGRSLRYMQRYYLRSKDLLFTSWSRPYNTVVFETLVQDAFGKDSTMADVKYPKMMFTATRADTFPCQLVLSRNYRLPLTEEENEELGFDDPKTLPVWLASRRSAAAPTYFAASEGKYIDGGMVANNPTLDIMSEIMFWNSTCEMKAHQEKDTRSPVPGTVRIGCVVSLGTGVTPVSPVDPSLFEMSDTLGMLRGIKNLSLMVLDQATATEGAPISRSRSWCHSLGIPYFRLNAPLFKDVMLDASDDSDIAKMMWDVEVYAHIHKKDFIELAGLLKAIGTTKHRKTFLGTDHSKKGTKA